MFSLRHPCLNCTNFIIAKLGKPVYETTYNRPPFSWCCCQISFTLAYKLDRILQIPLFPWHEMICNWKWFSSFLSSEMIFIRIYLWRLSSPSVTYTFKSKSVMRIITKSPSLVSSSRYKCGHNYSWSRGCMQYIEVVRYGFKKWCVIILYA